MSLHMNASNEFAGSGGLGEPTELTRMEFMRLSRQSPWRMLSMGSRLRSYDVLERLARDSTEGRMSWPRMLACIEDGTSSSQMREWNAPYAVCSVILACVLDPGPRHFSAASTVLHALAGESKLWTKGAAHALRLAAQTSVLTDAHALFREFAKLPFLPPGVVWAGETDFLRPQTRSEWDASDGAAGADGEPGQFDIWWKAFNAPFTERGLAPYGLQPEGFDDPERLFSAIRAPEVAPAALPREQQPLVTVIVPTYCPDAGFLNTIESLIRQSWSNLEVLIVDDSSPSGHEFLAAAAASDPRVRVIPLSENGGAYRARNAGLLEARGEFVAFQDADDLSHPKRIELQVLPLRENTGLIASVSRAQRVLTDGTLTYFGYLPHRTNASSLTFRRAPVLERLGRFDAVRKGADSEFTERLTSAFGGDSLLELPDPLSLVQLTLGSLSRSDFRPTWMSGNRLSYMRQFQAAHRSIAAQAAPDWRLSDARPAITRSAPGMRGEPARERLAVAVVSDWNDNMAPLRDATTLVRGLAAGTEQPVGLVNGVRPRFSSMERAPIDDGLAEAVERERAVWVNWIDPTRIDRLIFDSPEFLWALPHPDELGLQAGRVEIVLDEYLRRVDVPTLPPIEWCEDRVRERFGVRPVWLVASASLRDRLRSRGSDAELLSGIAAGPSGARPLVPLRPVIGVVLPARADHAQWDCARVLAQLPPSGIGEVVLYDETGALDPQDPLAQRLPVLTSGDCDREELLRRVGILVPDLFGERLLAAETWVRSGLRAGVPIALPYGVESMQQPPALRYPVGGARDLLSVLMLDPSYAEMRADSPARFEPAAEPPAIRFVILGPEDEEQVEATRESIRGLSDDHEIRVIHGDRIGDLLREGTLDGLSASSRVCLVPAGSRFATDAFAGLHGSAAEDLHVFSEAAYEYRLNQELEGVGTVVAGGGAPLWAGSTATLVRADVLSAVVHRYSGHGIGDGIAFAAALSVSGGFGVLGGVHSPKGHEDRADEAPEALTESWYTAFADDWAHLLETTRGIGPAHDYLQEVFVYLLAVRLRLNSGPGQKLTLSDAGFAAYSRLLTRALSTVDDARLWSPRTRGKALSSALRHFLLRLKHLHDFAPAQLEDADGPFTELNGLEIERPKATRITIDGMHTRDGVLTIHGRLPLHFDYPGYDLVLRTGEESFPLQDRGRYADVLLHGHLLSRARTFSAEIPLTGIGERVEFRYENDRVSLPLQLYFARAAAKLSYQQGAYWAIPGTGILTPVHRGIAIAPYSRRRLIAAEMRRQRFLRGSGDPVRVAAARLRLKYFLSRRRFSRKRIWMYADRIVKGGDNGEYAYAYAAAQNDGIEKHYVLRPGSALERQFLEKGLPYLSYGTDEQRLHYLNASVVFATRLSPTDTFGFQDDQKHFRDLFDARVVYINHGLVIDRLDYVLNAGYTDFERVCVVSGMERDNLLQPSYGYRPDQVEVTGFARYDGLVSAPRRTILLAPTWRTYLHDPQQGDRQADGHRAFRRTEYFRVFDSLINNPRLHEALRRFDYRFVFLLHPNASSQLADFQAHDERVEVRAATEDVSYEQLLVSADLMITDYSGVQFDFAHMRKPVVYYQPDSIPPHYREDSFDYERDAFGEVTGSEDELVDLLCAYLERDCVVSPRYERRIEEFFGHLDHDNAKRIYRVGREVDRRPDEEPHHG
ncbi:bifunctional glycosyltransferase/CDP-glycerol:glycerophosphate glycerophosphotransferase [Leucobacter sp.]